MRMEIRSGAMTVKMGMWIGILGLGLSLAFGAEQILAVFGLN